MLFTDKKSFKVVHAGKPSQEYDSAERLCNDLALDEHTEQNVDMMHVNDFMYIDTNTPTPKTIYRTY